MITWYGSLFIVTGLDSLFIGIGLHIIAGFKDLQKMIMELDKICLYKNTEGKFQNSIIFLHKITYCIHFHNFVLE